MLNKIYRYLLLLICLSHFVYADQINIAVASNFSEPIKQIAHQFELQFKTKVVISSSGTGALVNQIKNGAPFEILLSADQTTPTELAKDGYAISNSQFTYAQGKLVLWSSQKNLIQNNPSILKSNHYKFLAIANPKLAPYGIAAINTINKLGIMNIIKQKIIMGDNINSTYQYIATGNAELGFIALSQIMKNGNINNGSYWIVPASIIPPIKQDAIILAKGAKNLHIIQFLNFIKSEKIQSLIKNYGYQ